MTRIRFGTLRVIGTNDVSPTFHPPACFLYSRVSPPVPPGDTKLYKSPFFRDFWHLNVAMMNSNNALVPDPDKSDILASVPTDWPWLHLGLRMCGWGDTQTKYYLIGNPIVWWSGSASLIVGTVVLILYLLRGQRGYLDWREGKIAFVDMKRSGC